VTSSVLIRSLRTVGKLIVLVAALQAAVPTAQAAPASSPRPPKSRSAAPSAPLQLTLPRPTGPHPVGTVALHLLDSSRADGTVFSRGRELMISLWYPTRHTRHHPVAPWLPAAAGARFLQDEGLPAGAVQLPMTSGHEGAPVSRQRARMPVVLYSPGNDSFRSANTIIVQELASRGYMVVTIDHTGDGLIEFPDGRVEVPLRDGPDTVTMADTRVRDTRFVLDTLTALTRGANPDVAHRRLPAGLRGAFDPARVGMIGYSAGGATVASAMFLDRRIQAGLSLDGGVGGPVVTAGLERAYLLMDAAHTRFNDSDLATFYANLRGWHLNLHLVGGTHTSYSDEEILAAQLETPGGRVDTSALTTALAPERTAAIQRRYPLAFFDLHLRQHRERLLEGPSSDFPEVLFRP
jgi:dienelactone hydrolase